MNASSNTPAPATTNRRRNWLIASGIAVVIFSCLALFGLASLFGFGPSRTLVLVPLNPTAVEPTVAPTNIPPAPTQEQTEIAATPVPAPVSCDTPSIKAGLSAADVEFGEFLDTTLGKRMTFTSRKVIVPAKAWNDPLSESELKSVEQTWLFASVCVPEGMFGRIFAGGYEQGLNRFEDGVLMTLKPGVYEFKIRNGEIVLWYPENSDFAAKDLDRIVEQIKVGNFDIKAPLAFFGVTTDLMPSIPTELVKERNVQIVPFPETNTK